MTADWFFAALRHDRAVVLGSLTFVVALAWAWLLLGAGIDMEEMASFRFRGDRLGNAMGREDDWPVAIGDFIEFVDEDRPLGAEIVDHEFIVDDLMAHIDGRPIKRQRPLDDVDGADHPGAKAARGGQKEGEGGPSGAPQQGVAAVTARRQQAAPQRRTQTALHRPPVGRVRINGTDGGAGPRRPDLAAGALR